MAAVQGPPATSMIKAESLPRSEIEWLQRVKLHFLGIILSAIVYGILISVLRRSVTLIVYKKPTQYYTKRRKGYLLAYVMVMFLLSSMTLLQGTVYILRNIIRGVDLNSHHLLSRDEPLLLPFAIWGADGLMLWRCMMLYTGSSGVQRFVTYSLFIASSLASIGCGILYYIAPRLYPFSRTNVFLSPTIAISLSTLGNITLTGLLCGRLYFHQTRMRQLLGPDFGVPYRRIILLCCASCGIISVTSFSYIVVFCAEAHTNSDMSIIPLMLLPHICVLSPVFTIYYVAKGKTSTDDNTCAIVTEQTTDPADGHRFSPIQFRGQINMSTPGHSASSRMRSSVAHSTSFNIETISSSSEGQTNTE